MYLSNEEIKDLLNRPEDPLIIRPLLEKSQVGEITIDFRLGYDFLASIQGRDPYIDTSLNNTSKSKSISSFFHKTRRRPGETFLLHPSQNILGTSLEYIRLPSDICLALSMRSSYARLGITISTIVQPGYCGCISVELVNSSKNSINLTVGSRIFQARLIRMASSTNYFTQKRKYICQVRPQVSAAREDTDLIILKKYWDKLNSGDKVL